MNNEQLQRGKELETLIRQTEDGLKPLLEYQAEIKNNDRNEKRFYEDKCYWLTVAKHKDGSGHKGELMRYKGNEELLDVIIETLQKQITEFKTELESI
jgi:hypothetical protein